MQRPSTIVEAAAALRAGTLSAQTYADAFLARIEAAGELNAFLDVDPGAVRAAACAADARRASGAPLGALHGIPLAIKDNIDTAHLRTTAGTPALAQHRPTHDAPVVAALVAAGAIVLGKTNLHELAFGITSNNRAFGAVRNPVDPARIPGGSSGGTAAAVAGGLAPAGIGTDTGGSLRIPAALCGIVGFRPTPGRWPAGGIVPIARTRDTPGPMARTVADCALIDGVLTASAHVPPANGVRGRRIGMPRAQFWDALAQDVAAVLADALGALRAAGAVLVECEITDLAALAQAASAPINRYEIVRDLTAYLARSGLELTFADVAGSIASPDVAAIVQPLALPGGGISPAAYARAIAHDRPALQAAYARCFRENGIEALAFPTTPLAAAPIGDDDTTLLDGVPVPTFATYIKNTHPGSITGLPGVSIPAGTTPSGLPVGLALDGRSGDDVALLQCAAAAEACLAATRTEPRPW